MKMMTANQSFAHLVLLGVSALTALAFSLYSGLPYGNDFTHHFQLTNIIYDAISSGEIYPGWANLANKGYGDVTVRFYPPFSYYLMAGAFAITGDWYAAGLVVIFSVFWISGIGAYFWAREGLSPDQAVFAAIIYISAPYHINQIYGVFLYAEFAASAIIPFCLLFITRIGRGGNLGDIIGLVISYSLLILTHLPSTVIGSLTFAIYAVVLLRKKTFVKTSLKLIVSVVFAFAASCFYWIKLPLELDWVNLSNKSFYLGIYDYRRNFLLTPQNIVNFESDDLNLWFADLMLLTMLLISIPSTYFFIRERRNIPRFSLAVAIIFLVSVLMTLYPSKFIWDNLGFLQNIQFPWRWLGIVCLGGALFSTTGIIRLLSAANRKKSNLLTCVLSLILTLFFFTSAFAVKQAVFISRADVNKLATEIKSRSFDSFWWTKWSRPETLGISDQIQVINGTAVIRAWLPLERIVEVNTGATAKLRLATFYYPHWKAFINGQEVKVEKTADGALSVFLPAGQSEVRFIFEEPFAIKIARAVSIFVWLGIAFSTLVVFANAASRKIIQNKQLKYESNH